MVVDDQEQLGAHRGLDSRVRHPRPDQHVGHPALVRTFCLVAAEGLLFGHQGLALESAPAQLRAHGALWNPDPVAVEEDPGDLGGRSRRALETQRADVVDKLGMRAHRPGVRSRLGLEALQTLSPPHPDPAVDGGPRVAPRGPVGMCVLACGNPSHERAALGFRQAFCERLCDHAVAVQCDLLSDLVVHVILLFMSALVAQEA